MDTVGEEETEGACEIDGEEEDVGCKDCRVEGASDPEGLSEGAVEFMTVGNIEGNEENEGNEVGELVVHRGSERGISDPQSDCEGRNDADG